MPKRPAGSARSSRSVELIERASWALNMNHPGDAARLASEVLKAERGNLAAASLLGQALLAQNRAGEAIAPLEKAARRSDDPALETLLAIALAASGLRDEALAQLRRTTARRPMYPPAFRELASQLGKAGDSGQAIAVLEACLADMPGLVELRLHLAWLRLGRNERGHARSAADKALAVAPGRPDVLALQGRVLLLDGEYVAAADAYREALAKRPDDAMTRAEFAVCLMEMGEREAGEANLRAATRGRREMLLRGVHFLAASARGRLFLRPSAVIRFLQDEPA
jgi:predicted Zn-dependent protease